MPQNPLSPTMATNVIGLIVENPFPLISGSDTYYEYAVATFMRIIPANELPKIAEQLKNGIPLIKAGKYDKNFLCATIILPNETNQEGQPQAKQ